MITRRNFTCAAAAASLQAAPAAKPKIALVITEYRRNAHADVIGTRLLGGYDYNGKRQQPRVQVVSMFTDQIAANDLSRPYAKKHNVPIYDTVRDALTLGGASLAVEGVAIVGEHGRYPYNEKGQHLYPRYELFSQVVEVFKSSGRTVPVFSDKHLSTEWWKAKWMYDQSREMHFPFLAGSSVTVAWRRPEMELPAGAKLRHAVAAAYGGLEAYGYHSLESLQCQAERRAGGETGVAAAQCLEGADVWRWTDANPWAQPLLDAAVARSETRTAGNLREIVKQPALFIVQYKDGFQGLVYMLNGGIQDFTFAAQVEGRKQIDSTLFFLQPGRPYAHFSGLVWWIEDLMLNKRAPYPVERTLLVTGTLASLMESAWRGHTRIETPHLDVAYQPAKGTFYNRGAAPPLKEDI
ncbi:MAG: hypothetical protein R2729_17295 [Bryobacteraceae bacterium]